MFKVFMTFLHNCAQEMLISLLFLFERIKFQQHDASSSFSRRRHTKNNVILPRGVIRDMIESKLQEVSVV